MTRVLLVLVMVYLILLLVFFMWAFLMVLTGLAEFCLELPPPPLVLPWEPAHVLRSYKLMRPSLPPEARTFSSSCLYETDLMLAAWPARVAISV